MPSHCDTMDGPVVTAAKRALETRNVNLILPWVPKNAEPELKKSFEKTLRVRKQGKEKKLRVPPRFKRSSCSLAPGIDPNLGLNPCFLHKSRILIGDTFQSAGG